MLKPCEEIRETLSAYIDDMLPKEEAEEVAAHIEQCADCQADYDFLKNMTETAKNMPEIAVSQALHENILSKLDAELTREKTTKFSFWKTASRLTAAAAVVAISVISLNSLPTQPEPTPNVITQDVTKNKKFSFDVSQPLSYSGKEIAEHDATTSQPTEKPVYLYQKNTNTPAIPEEAKDVSAPSANIEEQDRRRMAIHSSVIYVLEAESMKDARHLLAPYESDGIYMVPRAEFALIHEQITAYYGYQSHEISETDPPGDVIEIILKNV